MENVAKRNPNEATPKRLERLECLICNLTDIHVNDYENHLNGKKHKFRTRHNEPGSPTVVNGTDEPAKAVGDENGSLEKEELTCELCKTKFSDLGFYEVHIGTKRHRRKIRKSKMSTRGKNEDDSSRRAQIFMTKRGRRSDFRTTTSELPHKPIREKYKPRIITNDNDHFKSYIYSIAAYWAVYLALDDTVPDFKLSVNDKRWGSFGDICIEIFWRETDITYVVQFKQITDNMKVIGSLTEGKFDIKKQLVGLSDIKHIEDLSKIKFVVFTTCVLEPEATSSVSLQTSLLPNKWRVGNNVHGAEENITLKIKPLNNKKKDILNTTDDNENIFLVTLDKTYQLPRLYLYANQKKVKHFGMDIDELVRKKFGNCPEIHKQFIAYIENWIEGLLGGSFKLKKHDVCLKISDILLSPHVADPQIRSLVDIGENYDLWNKVMENVDITVVKNKPHITWRMCKPINKIIENFFAIKLDTITQTIYLRHDILNTMKNAKVKSYLFEETLSNIEAISLKTMYVIFWKAELIPLILFVEHNSDLELVMKAITMTKHKRFILQTPLEINRHNLTKTYKHFRFFTNLDDLKHLFDIILGNTFIKVSETYSISLKTIQVTDEFFLKTITPDIFFDICLGKYSFKAADPFSNHKSAEEMKLILSDEVMDELYDKIMGKSNDVLLRSTNEDPGWLRNVNPHLL